MKGSQHATLNPCAWAAALGILFGLDMVLHALFRMFGVNFFWYNETMFNLVASATPFYTASISGAIVGLIIGFVCGAICGGVFAWLHNKMAACHSCSMCK